MINLKAGDRVKVYGSDMELSEYFEGDPGFVQKVYASGEVDVLMGDDLDVNISTFHAKQLRKLKPSNKMILQECEKKLAEAEHKLAEEIRLGGLRKYDYERCTYNAKIAHAKEVSKLINEIETLKKSLKRARKKK